MRDLKSWPVTESSKQIARPAEKSLRQITLLVRVFLKDSNQHFHTHHDREKDRTHNESYRERSWGNISQDLGMTN